MKFVDPMNPFTINPTSPKRFDHLDIGGLRFLKIPAGSTTIGRKKLDTELDRDFQLAQMPQLKIFVGEYWICSEIVLKNIEDDQEVEDFCNQFFARFGIPISSPSEVQWEKAIKLMPDDWIDQTENYLEWTNSFYTPYIGSPGFRANCSTTRVIRDVLNVTARHRKEEGVGVAFRPIISCSISPLPYCNPKFQLNSPAYARIQFSYDKSFFLDFGDGRKGRISHDFFCPQRLKSLSDQLIKKPEILVVPVSKSEKFFNCVCLSEKQLNKFFQ